VGREKRGDLVAREGERRRHPLLLAKRGDLVWREKEREGGAAAPDVRSRRPLSLSPQVDAIARLDRAVAEVRNDVTHKDLVS